MSPAVPDTWATVLLALASYRVWRLIAEDSVFDRPRRWLVNLPRDWEDTDFTVLPPKPADPLPENYRGLLAEWLTCPWCSSLPVIAVWYLAWWADESWTLFVAGAFALWCAVGLIRSTLDPPE